MILTSNKDVVKRKMPFGKMLPRGSVPCTTVRNRSNPFLGLIIGRYGRQRKTDKESKAFPSGLAPFMSMLKLETCIPIYRIECIEGLE